MKRKKHAIFIFIMLLFTLIVSLFYTTIRSYFIMYSYSFIHKINSTATKKNIPLYIPSGAITKEKDWYPFMIYYNDDKGFSKYMDKDLSFSVLYSFGHFDIKNGYSSFYNPESPYYSSYYGAYVVSNNQQITTPFGFNEDGTVNVEELISVPEYDQTKLALASIGCPSDKLVFKASINNIVTNINYANQEGWTKVDSIITTNSPLHIYSQNYSGYIQYGAPPKNYIGENFPVITLKGRTYVKYFQEYNATIALYIMAPYISTLEDCDKKILSKSKIGH